MLYNGFAINGDMMKKYLLAVALAFMSGVSTAGPVLSFNPVNASIGIGGTTSVSIDLSGAVDVYAFQFDILFTPGFLSVSPATSGFFLSDGTGFFSGIVDNVGGSLSLVSDAVVGSPFGVDGSGNLANLVFTGIGNGSANVQFANLIFLDSSLRDITDVSSTGGTITVGAGGTVPTPGSAILVLTALVAGALVTRTSRRVLSQPN